MDADELRKQLRLTQTAYWIAGPAFVCLLVTSVLYGAAFTQSIALTRSYQQEKLLQSSMMEWLWLANTACTNTTRNVVTDVCRRPLWAWMDYQTCGNFTEQVLNAHCSSVADFIQGEWLYLNASLHPSAGQLAYSNMQANSTLFALVPKQPKPELWIQIQDRLLQMYELTVGPWILFAWVVALVLMLGCIPIWLHKQLADLQRQRLYNMAKYNSQLNSVVQSVNQPLGNSSLVNHSTSATSFQTVSALSDDLPHRSHFASSDTKPFN